ncbi:hypothetical protein K450DRAFT_248825 [Umbelopsis ramanniana AG]|uniref:Uncharacterized protein n=1 Tax=Umbelopsis ramanniana AG TaxID=1314678 RepID=A0AAD5E837_UMBRA|nr:uncharacterized protein K450DRAFT_248825 [Umbelopsis ramanniana AG]KAI8578060.1 hypothetical protein K450DRAFT_248825 [Umbelopsis ramanniana AG]
MPNLFVHIPKSITIPYDIFFSLSFSSHFYRCLCSLLPSDFSVLFLFLQLLIYKRSIVRRITTRKSFFFPQNKSFVTKRRLR